MGPGRWLGLHFNTFVDGGNMKRLIALVLALFAATPAWGQWYEATTPHLIVYGAADEATVRAAAVRLEKYDFLLRALSGVRQRRNQPKLRVYLMRNMAGVQATLGGGSYGVAGYYNATARGAFNVNTLRVPSYRNTLVRTAQGRSEMELAREVLQHEYAHHFMRQNFPANYPAWYSEGFAEFYGTAEIGENDVIEVGHAPEGRMMALQQSEWMPIDRLLSARGYGDVGQSIGALYAQGWLLVHYASANTEVGQQLRRYLELAASGQSYRSAMETVWGPEARELNTALRRYATSGRLNALRLPFRTIDIGQVTMRRLRPAEEELIFHDIRINAGILQSEIATFAAFVRRIAQEHPNDVYAQRILAETERLAGNHEASAAAATRVLQLDPRNAKGMLLQAQARFQALRAASNTDEAAWDAGREMLLAANRLDTMDAEIPLAYYQSYRTQNLQPPLAAQNVLIQALNLVPQATEMRMLAAIDFEQRELIDDAIETLRPLASSAHDSDDDPAAQERDRRLRERYRTAGQEVRETPRQMLLRLERGRAARTGAAPAPAAPVPPPSQ